ncbi:hypothetical protein OEZ85_011158 [Tetradesmus obliquus]|uniref:Uncharacterized protein n=1 Tax=Tetradesmus obliquus TaxID=3088 RepID=A0ABY8TRS1_TETOB|nr:hypothetical protein OEZ85_011158 [Tetradesmus obliquus]
MLLALDVRNNNTAMSELEKQVSAAIARQLRLLDSNGDPDAGRVMCWVDTGASEPGQTWLEAYVWLSPANCEVTADIWQSLVSSNPQALFDQAADPELSAAVQNVTSLPREPTAAQYVKMGVQGSRSYVQSIAHRSPLLCYAVKTPPNLVSSANQAGFAAYPHPLPSWIPADCSSIDKAGSRNDGSSSSSSTNRSSS